MDIAILSLVFLSAVAVSGCVAMAFSAPMESVLGRVIPPEMSQAWSRYAKFGLFTASFTGGLRLPQLAAIAAQKEPPTADEGLVEVFRTLSGSLTASSWTLLAFFAATLAAYAAGRVYEAFKAPAPRERHGVMAGRV